MTASLLPQGRYGPRARAGRSRRAAPLVMVLGAVAGLVVALIGYRNLAETPVEAHALGFELLTADPAAPAVSLRLQVVRQEPGRPAVCIVRARSRDGEETGRREVYVPPATGPVELTTVIHTSRPPVTADVFGCSLRVPAYLPGSSS